MPSDDVLLDEALVPDPDAQDEMGAESEAIADQDVHDYRVLLLRRAVEAVDLAGTPGGAVALAYTFQPAPGCRFTSARLLLRLTEPQGVRIAELEPRQVREKEPVTFVLDRKGSLSLKYL